jgi:two-component system chemotaxis response regulator CheV
MAKIKDKEILLETGTNELEILELFLNLPGSDPATPEPCHFGVNVAKVMQVIESPRLEHPESADHPSFLGTISLRKHIVPVIDLSVWLGMERVQHKYEVVIVTEFSQAVTGFLVSGVTEIHRVGWEQVEPPSDYISSHGTQALIGMVNMGDHFIQLLDLESILADLDPSTINEADQTDVRAPKNYKALVADDSATIRLMLQKNLEASNFVPSFVNTGEEALNRLRELKSRAASEGREITDFLDIVIADIEMPRMDGFSLTKNIKEDPVLQKIPVILYSSLITDELRHKGESVLADDQVSKPEMNFMAQRAIKVLESRP